MWRWVSARGTFDHEARGDTVSGDWGRASTAGAGLKTRAGPPASGRPRASKDRLVDRHAVFARRVAGAAAAVAPALPAAAPLAGASRAPTGVAPASAGRHAGLLVDRRAVFARGAHAAELTPRPGGGGGARRYAVLELVAQGADSAALEVGRGSLGARGPEIMLHSPHWREPG